MPWVRFEDRYPRSRKVRPLSDAAFRLDVSGICWSAENTTDGRIADDELELVADIRKPRPAVDELVRRGRWHAPGHNCATCPPVENGWIIHDYLNYNPSKEKVARDRDAKAERQRRWIETRRRPTEDASTDTPQDAPRDASLTPSITQPPTRPDPITTTTHLPASGSEPAARDNDPPGPPGRVETLLAEHRNAVGGKVNPRAMTELGQHLADLCHNGYTDDQIRAGFALWRNRGVRPSSLPDLVDYATRNGARTPTPTSRGITPDERVAAIQALKTRPMPELAGGAP